MKRQFKTGLLSLVLFSLFLLPTKSVLAWPFAYITNMHDLTVSVIDTATNIVIKRIPLVSDPIGVAVHPDGTVVYVSLYGPDIISVIDTATHTVTATIPAGDHPIGMGVRPDGAYLYVANQNADTVSVFNTATHTGLTTISVGNGPFGLAIHPDGTFVYVTNYYDNTVSVINTATHKVGHTIPVGTGPSGLAVHPGGTFVYVTNSDDDTISVINTATHLVSKTVPVGDFPYAAAVHPDGSKVYITNADDNNISVIDTATHTASTTISTGLGPRGITVTPDGVSIYVANSSDDTISAIDTASNRSVQTISAGDGPIALGVFIGGPGQVSASGSTPTLLFDDTDDEDYSPNGDWIVKGEGGSSDSDTNNSFTISGASETSSNTIPIVTLRHDGGNSSANDSVNSIVVDSNGDVGLCSDRFYFDRNQTRMGIGTTTPQEELHVVGNVYVHGDIELGSSREFKEGIETLEPCEAMAALKALRPVTFNYKHNPGEESIGFIAEEVPGLVAANNRKAIRPMDILAILTKVIQEQQQTIDDLGREIDMLKQGIPGPR
ncbi:MAG: hypothetical protein D3926_07630 [Desulfobacteraceae bacterium]|nr:MAG: hypothetical protein D3926_07630 [Desulfobacteraceae bacterium]